MAIDLFLGIGLPIIVMVLHYTVQPHRFDIYEGYGCSTSTWASIPSIFAVSWWPVLLSVAAAIYGVIAIKFFLSRRLQFQTLLKSSKGGLDSKHYVRLMALASVDILLALPLTLFSLSMTIIKRQDYKSWDIVHYDWSRVDYFLAEDVLNNSTNVTSIVLPRWHSPLIAILFFLFFGVSIDATSEYSRWINSIKSIFGKIKGGEKFSKNRNSKQTLPHFVPKLGSTVVQPAGGDWKPRSIIDESLHEVNYNPDSPRSVRHSGRDGVSVAVRVEREVV